MVASAIGYYGSNPEKPCEEETSAGDDFLAKLCQEWEKTARQAATERTRVVNLRFGTLLSPKGGTLKRLLPSFLSGVAGKIATGQQSMSWISLDDALGALHYILREQDLCGPINLVAPTPVSNVEFTKTLGRILKRPTLLPLPKILVKTIFGEMGEKLLLSSIHAAPQKLLEHGFHFQHNQIEEALRAELDRYS